MSEPFNQLLLAPSEGRLVAALEQASRRSGLDGKGAEHWRPLLDEVADNADGRSQMEHSSPDREGSRYLVVAWWTDHQGRKLVRVAGGDTDDEAAHRHFSRLDIDARPALWHVGPGRVYRVKRAAEQPAWVVCCGCGETGDPEELAWMGDCCGPCHDRREEGEAVAEAAPSVTHDAGALVFGLAVAPCGQLACSVEGRQVLLIDLAARSGQTLFAGGDALVHEQIRHLVFSPEGDFLAVGDPQGMAVRAWHLRSGETFALSLDEGESITGPVFSPDGRFLAALTDAGFVMAWCRRGDGWVPAWNGVFCNRAGVTALAFSPDGRTLALGGPQGKVYLTTPDTGADQGQISVAAGEDVLWLEYLPGGQRLLLLTGSLDPSEGLRPWKLRLWDLNRSCEERSAELWPMFSVALAPDGRHLAYLYRDQRHSPAAVYFWDVRAWEPAGWLESDSEAYLTALAFTADGRSLVTGTDAGVVRLYPWRLLLGPGRNE